MNPPTIVVPANQKLLGDRGSTGSIQFYFLSDNCHTFFAYFTGTIHVFMLYRVVYYVHVTQNNPPGTKLGSINNYYLIANKTLTAGVGYQ